MNLNSVKEEFYSIASFPDVIGAIDCTHVRIQSPGGENAERFRNRKGYFSINCQVNIITVVYMMYIGNTCTKIIIIYNSYRVWIGTFVTPTRNLNPIINAINFDIFMGNTA